MSPSGSSSSGIDIAYAFVFVYWGFVISLFLGGITILQAYIYFPARKDSLTLRWTAISILILDITSSALLAQSVYHYLTANFGTVSLLPLNPEISAECLISTLLTFNSQLYFAYQLYSVKGLGTARWIVVGAIVACTILAFAGGVACVSSMYIFYKSVLGDRSILFSVSFGLAKGFGALADILATIAMCMFLTSAKTGIGRTNTLLNNLMKFVIHRGALVTLTQTLLLITFYAMPNHLYWMAFHINVTKLYANTFFAMLNGRQHLRENMSHFSKAILSSSSQSTQNTVRQFSNQNYDHHIESQSFNIDMPTITKTVVIADM